MSPCDAMVSETIARETPRNHKQYPTSTLQVGKPRFAPNPVCIAYGVSAAETLKSDWGMVIGSPVH